MANEVVLRFLEQPGEKATSCGPGPFSMADETFVRNLMEAAGYTDTVFRRVDAPVLIGNDIREAIEFQLSLGPAGEVFREAGEAAEEKRGEIEDALADAIGAHQLGRDSIVMDSSSWVISAVNARG